MGTDTKSPKKLEILYILDLLKEHTDSEDPEHCLTQSKIAELLRTQYNMTVDRKSVKHNLSKLLEAYEDSIRYTDFERVGSSGNTQLVKTGWHYAHDFTESELRVMIDSILFSNYLPSRHRNDLINKIIRLGSKYSRAALSDQSAVMQERPVNKSMFSTIDIIGRAITDKRQVSFVYNHYERDKKLHPKLSGGRKKIYIVSPVKLLSHNGRYYLLAGCDGHDDLTNFRVDRITETKELDAPAVSIRSFREFENGVDLAQYVNEHPNMWGGKVVPCRFRCPEYLINDIVDWFGANFKVVSEEGSYIEVSVRVSEEAMKHWAVQYADCVEVMFPESLRETVRQTLREALARYEDR